MVLQEKLGTETIRKEVGELQELLPHDKLRMRDVMEEGLRQQEGFPIDMCSIHLLPKTSSFDKGHSGEDGPPGIAPLVLCWVSRFYQAGKITSLSRSRMEELHSNSQY